MKSDCPRPVVSNRICGGITMRRALICSICAIGLAYPASVDADSPKKLKGAYAFTGTASCLWAPGWDPAFPPPSSFPLPNSGFDGNLRPNPISPPAPTGTFTDFTSSDDVEGIAIFNGDGTGTVTGTSVSIAHRPTPGPIGYPNFARGASSSTFQASFTYTVNSDDTFDRQLAGPLTGTVLTGGRAGQTFSINTIPLTGLISKDGKTLTIASIVPTVETVTYSTSEIWPRICHRSRVLIKMDKD